MKKNAKSIVLLGYRGCGKTTVGQLLAKQLRMDYADVDQLICSQFDHRTVADIWANEGEPAYRVAEVQVTRDLVKQKNKVIGLGGGTLMQPAAKQAIVQADVCCIYLRCATEELFRRIESDSVNRSLRPSLTKLGGGLEEIQTVLQERGPVYEAVAQHVLDVTDQTPQQVAALIATSASNV